VRGTMGNVDRINHVGVQPLNVPIELIANGLRAAGNSLADGSRRTFAVPPAWAITAPAVLSLRAAARSPRKYGRKCNRKKRNRKKAANAARRQTVRPCFLPPRRCAMRTNASQCCAQKPSP
jgi:hypothetical protein